jgi:hypothetical protein
VEQFPAAPLELRIVMALELRIEVVVGRNEGARGCYAPGAPNRGRWAGKREGGREKGIDRPPLPSRVPIIDCASRRPPLGSGEGAGEEAPVVTVPFSYPAPLLAPSPSLAPT